MADAPGRRARGECDAGLDAGRAAGPSIETVAGRSPVLSAESTVPARAEQIPDRQSRNRDRAQRTHSYRSRARHCCRSRSASPAQGAHELRAAEPAARLRNRGLDYEDHFVSVRTVRPDCRAAQIRSGSAFRQSQAGARAHDLLVLAVARRHMVLLAAGGLLGVRGAMLRAGRARSF